MDIPQDLKNRYLERRRKDIVTFEGAVLSRDFAVLERMGHQIKGNAVSFGYPELESIGRDIEILARDQNLEGLRDQLQMFMAWVRAQAGPHSLE